MGFVSQECREFLDSQLWDEIIPKAILYAARRLERYEWQGSKKGRPPMGRSAQDFVNNVILSLYQGDRTWDQEKHPNFFRVLCGMIKSEIYNCLASNENKETVCEAALPSSEWTNAPLDAIEHPTGSADESLIKVEQEIEDDKLLMAFITHIEDDRELMDVLDCKLKGIFKPAEITQQLGITSQKMENLQKKWKRRIEDFQKKNKIGSKIPKGGKS